MKDGELVSHLLHCCFASEVWAVVLADFGMSWVMPRDVKLWLNGGELQRSPE